MTTLWDISPPVDGRSPGFPGDTESSQVWGATVGPNCPVNVSAITLSPHTGAHADAPLHYEADAAPIGAVSLEPFLGPCRVIHAIGVGPLGRQAHLAHALPPMGATLPARVLVRTYATAPLHQFDPDCAAFAPETVEALADL